MRYSILLLLLIISSCRHSIEKNEIVGSWTMDDRSKKELGIVDTTIFLSSGIVIYKAYMKGQLQETFTSKFEINSKENLLIVYNDSSQSLNKILELTSEKLILKTLNPEGIIRYIKL
jgi:hypothetical protein